jgi:hypothetical protein
MLSKGKLGAQQVFQLQFLHFALQLLRALFRPALEVFDLLLHRGNGLLLLHYLELLFVFGFFLRLAADFGQAVLYALFDGEFEFAFGVVEFALLLDEFGLGLLGFGQLFVARLEHFLKFGEFARFAFEFRRGGLLGFLRFFGDNAGTLGLQLRGDLIGHLLVEVALGLGDLLFLVAEALLALCDVLVLLCKLPLELLARRRDQGRGKGLGQPDFGLAVGAGDGRFCHGITRPG